MHSEQVNSNHVTAAIPAPFPYGKLALISSVCFASAISFSGLFPYAGFMVSDLMHISPDEAGYYAGYLSAAMMMGRVFSSVPWGMYADIHGRKPTLLIGLLTITITSITFGLSENMILALSSRFLLGLFNPIIAIGKTLISEVTNKEQEAQGMAVLTGTWGVGLVFGPALGGLLSRPVQSYPGLFQHSDSSILQVFAPVLIRYPYLLPNLCTALYAFVEFFVVWIYFEETLVTTPAVTVAVAVAVAVAEPATTTADTTTVTATADTVAAAVTVGRVALQKIRPVAALSISGNNTGTGVSGEVIASNSSSNSSNNSKSAGAGAGAGDQNGVRVSDDGDVELGNLSDLRAVAVHRSTGRNERGLGLGLGLGKGKYGRLTQEEEEEEEEVNSTSSSTASFSLSSSSSSSLSSSSLLSLSSPLSSPSPPSPHESGPYFLLSNFPTVRRALVGYFMLSMVSITFDEVMPLWALSSISKGGLEYTNVDIGEILSVTGGGLILYTMVLFPRLSKAIGSMNCFRLGLRAAGPLFVLCTFIPDVFGPFKPAFVYAALAINVLICKLATTTAFTANALLVNNSVPAPSHRALVNGLAMSLGSIAKVIGPVIGATLFAWSIKEHGNSDTGTGASGDGADGNDSNHSNQNASSVVNFRFVFILLAILALLSSLVYSGTLTTDADVDAKIETATATATETKSETKKSNR